MTIILRKNWKACTFLIALFFLAHSTFSQCNEINTAFKEGEKVTYNAYYNWHFIWMNAGLVTFKTELQKYQNKSCYKLSSVGITHKNYDVFYKVRDTFISIVDTAYLAPLYSKRITNEGSTQGSENYNFDESKKTISSFIINEEKNGVKASIPWQSCTFDLLTMVYRARNINFNVYKKNDKIPIRLIVDGIIYNLYIRYLGHETIKTKEGRTFRCIKFSPLLMKGTIFEAGEDMTVWVTDDKNRIPILVEASILIGSVKAMFVSAEGAKYPFESEIIK